MMRRSAGLDPDQARWQLLEKCYDVAPLQLTADDHLAFLVDAMDLKHRFGDVETDRRHCLHNCLLRNVGTLTAHFHGTPVPVEGPSTASIADLGCGYTIGADGTR